MSIEESKIKLFNNIRKLREAKNMSVLELSERTGLPLEMLEQLDQNILPEEMMVDDAIALARVFRCKGYELFK